MFEFMVEGEFDGEIVVQCQQVFVDYQIYFFVDWGQVVIGLFIFFGDDFVYYWYIEGSWGGVGIEQFGDF